MGSCQGKSRSDPRLRTTTTYKSRESGYVKMLSIPVEQEYTFLKCIRNAVRSQVHEVRQKQSDQLGVCKQVAINDKDDYAQTLEELNAVRILDHPNLVRVLECYQQPWQVSIVMENCSGGELLHYLARHPSACEAVVADCMRQVCAAVASMHSKGFIHRDLRPEHLVLADESGPASVKLVSFGCTLQVTQSRKKIESRGSLYYMAPEAIRAYYSQKGDVWSIGVMCFLFLSGRVPFDAKTQDEIRWKIEQETPSFESWMSAEAQDFISSLLTKKPKNRPSMAEVMKHPWLQPTRNRTEQQLPPQVSCGLLKHSALCEFYRGLLSIRELQKVQTKEISILVNLFESLDINHDGKLSPEELRRGGENINVGVWIDVPKILKACKKDGFIDRRDFVNAVNEYKEQQVKQWLQTILERFNCSRGETVSLDSLMTSLGCEDTEDENFVVELIRSADSRCGDIEFGELSEYFLNALGSPL